MTCKTTTNFTLFWSPTIDKFPTNITFNSSNIIEHILGSHSEGVSYSA